MNVFTIPSVFYTIAMVIKLIVIETLSKRQKQRKNENRKPATASLVYDLTQRLPLTLPTLF